MRRRTGRWVELLDDRILEYLTIEQSTAPRTIAKNRLRPISVHLVRERCHVLSQRGLLRPEDRDCDRYAITVWGRLYLDGDVAADQIVPQPDARREGHVMGEFLIAVIIHKRMQSPLMKKFSY